MFSQGQWIFAGLFLVAFIIAAIFVYRRDSGLHKQVYKGSYRVLIAFLLFVAALFIIKIYLKH
ncbi:MAG: hypothetical protein EOO50_04635 [Flavobacterium sp.]|uniref:hypothetical protein n=1 Tax=Flavobacterium sp. TaxID=239 RepID=UPI00121AE0CA|nr:hypothetical protein [Flavobacterium sp.]RZJ67575.1 MAG: hypothetical protein EOO50_04635 [Flavobacterium sp.]